MKADLLVEALQIAAVAHQAKTDKAGQPYILHPIRVMLQMDDEASRVVAILHDVIEDTEEYELESFRWLEGMTDDIVDALDAITRRKNEDYGAYLARVKTNPLALRVKLADIRDNWDRLSALQEIDPDEAARLRLKYNYALAVLKGKAQGEQEAAHRY